MALHDARQKLVRMSLRRKLFLLLIPVLIIFTGMNMFQYRYARAVLKGTAITNAEHNFDIIASETNYSMRSLVSEAKRIASTQMVRQYLAMEDQDEGLPQLQRSLRNELFNVIVCNKYIQSIYLIQSPSQYIISSPYWFESDRSLIDLVYRDSPSGAHFYSFDTDAGIKFCCVASLSGNTLNQRASYIVFLMNPDYYKQLFSKYASPGIPYMLLDRKMNSLYASESIDKARAVFESNNRQLATFEDKEDYIFSRSLYDDAFVLISAVSKRRLFSEMDRVQRNLLVANLSVSLLLVAFLSKFFSIFTGRIGQLNGVMETVAQGNYAERCHFDNDDEIGRLGQHLDSMLQNLQTLVIEASFKEVQLKRIQLDTIKSQSSPHFLYNALETVRMIALRNGDREIPEIIKHLSRLLRYSTMDTEYVTIREEFSQIERYLYLQRLRFRDKFSYTIDIDARAEEQRIPRLFLQPLVENSFKHGIESASWFCSISITCSCIEGGYRFLIRDTGVGMHPSTIEAIREYQQSGSADSGKLGIGIKSVIDRLKLYYPNGSCFQVESSPGQGTTILITINHEEDRQA